MALEEAGAAHQLGRKLDGLFHRLGSEGLAGENLIAELQGWREVMVVVEANHVGQRQLRDCKGIEHLAHHRGQFRLPVLGGR